MLTRLKYLLIGSLGLVGMIGLAILFTQIAQNLRTKSSVQPMARQAIAEIVNAPTVAPSATQIDSPLPTPTATLEPIPTSAPPPNPYPPIAWDPLPPCKNEPWDSVQWLQYLTQNGTEPAAKQALSTLFLRQIHPLSAALQGTDMAGLLDLLATKDSDPDEVKVLRRDVASVWLNVIGGHLHRITELALADVPEAKTVRDLLNQVEGEIAKNSSPKSVQAGLSQLLSGKGITKSVCAQMLTSRRGNKIEQALWTEDGITQSEIWKRPSNSSWITYRLSTSPDYRNIAIESFGNETGGPIFLLNLASGNLRNLISELGHTFKAEVPKEGLSYDQSYPWEVIGWHPDGHHLLIGVKDSGEVIWINLQNNTYRFIVPAIGSGLSGSEEEMDLARDGSGFAYINRGHDSDTQQQLNFYDLSSNQITTLFTIPKSEGDLYYPRFSPSDDSIAYLVESGHPSTGMRYSIRLFDR